MKTLLCTLASALALSTLAAAQQPSIYVDFEGLGYTSGSPTNTFAAAAPSGGTWNVVDVDPILTVPFVTPPLNNTSGTATAVTLEFDSTLGVPPLSFSQDDPLTMGEDQTLLDDCCYFNGPGTFTFSGLPAGTYDVYTYCLAPDVLVYPAPPLTTVDVTGSTGLQNVMGDFSAGYALGVTHALHTVTVAAGGVIEINTDVPNIATDFDSINGIQIVPSGGGSLSGTAFCAANNNSTGVPGQISATGSSAVADNDVTLRVSEIPTLQFGIFVVAASANATTPVNDGILCLSGATGRYSMPGQIWQADANGEASLTIDLTMIPTPTALVNTNPGDTWFFQAWHRDLPTAPGQPGSNFTTGIEITFN